MDSRVEDATPPSVVPEGVGRYIPLVLWPVAACVFCRREYFCFFLARRIHRQNGNAFILSATISPRFNKWTFTSTRTPLMPMRGDLPECGKHKARICSASSRCAGCALSSSVMARAWFSRRVALCLPEIAGRKLMEVRQFFYLWLKIKILLIWSEFSTISFQIRKGWMKYPQWSDFGGLLPSSKIGASPCKCFQVDLGITDTQCGTMFNPDKFFTLVVLYLISSAEPCNQSSPTYLVWLVST